ERVGETLLVDCVGIEPPRLYLARQGTRRLDDFRLAAIVEGHHQRQAGIGRRLGLDVLDEPDERRLQPRPHADDPYLDVVADKALQIRCNKAPQQIENEGDFILWPRPVLGGETEYGQILDAVERAQFDQ